MNREIVKSGAYYLINDRKIGNWYEDEFMRYTKTSDPYNNTDLVNWHHREHKRLRVFGHQEPGFSWTREFRLQNFRVKKEGNK